MSVEFDDGGPAYPCHTNPLPSKLANAPQGMNLRDYFAGQALAGEFATQSDQDGVFDCVGQYEFVARKCYKMADAMLSARREVAS